MTSNQFEFEYHRLFLPLCMYALRVVGDESEAKDCVQDAFLKSWQVLESGRMIGDLKPFLYIAVRNEALMRLRKRHDVESLDSIPDVTEETYDTAERDAKLWRAIDALPDGCRRVFLMSKRDGLSNAEIAEELGVSIKTVENQITKAYKRLRGDLPKKVFFLPFL